MEVNDKPRACETCGSILCCAQDAEHKAEKTQRVQRDLICRLMAELVAADPKRLPPILSRFGFKIGDVSFMVTDKGRFWTEAWHWPWDPREDDDEPREESAFALDVES